MSLPSSGSSAALQLSPARLLLEPGNIVLVGPPGSGKSAAGRRVAERLGRSFVDTDTVVAGMAGKSIQQIFAEDGEAEFRRLEAEACRQAAAPAGRVIACGGGVIQDPANRAQLEAGGTLVCLNGSPETLLARMGGDGPRPLLAGKDPAGRLGALLEARRRVYRTVPLQIDTTALSLEQVASRIADLPEAKRTIRLTARRPRPGYSVMLGDDLYPALPDCLERAGLRSPFVVVTDSNVAPRYGEAVCQAVDGRMIVLPAGEEHKHLQAAADLYSDFLQAGLDRHGTVIALGGGVLLDVAGFAAATYMRGVRWVALPTTLLATVDASLGGKVGVNLPDGKNLVGAFHAPRAVIADLSTLGTLPKGEVETGLAEMIKAALIGDPELFARMESGPPWITRSWIYRSIQVKLAIVDQDPLERGMRAGLNLGHTFAHAFEAASDYRLPHGRAVSIGLVGAARLGQGMGLCDADLPQRVEGALQRYRLPTHYAGLNADHILQAMRKDKKRDQQEMRFVLLRRPGQVEVGALAPEVLVMDVIRGLGKKV